MARAGVMLMFIVWAGLAFYGVYAFQTIEATGDGFTRGSNRVGAFFKWEAFALIPAFVSWRVSRAAQGGALRWLGRTPIMLSGGFFALVILAFGGALLIARFSG